MHSSIVRGNEKTGRELVSSLGNANKLVLLLFCVCSFCSAYNTSLSDSATPPVYAADGPHTNVIPTDSSASTPAQTPVPVQPGATLQALTMLPHLSALGYYTQASGLSRVCNTFNVVLQLVSVPSTNSGSSGSSGSLAPGTNSGGSGDAQPPAAAPGTGYPPVDAAAVTAYRANGGLFGLLAIASFGMLLILQLAFFILILAGRWAVKKLQNGVFQSPAAAAMQKPTSSPKTDKTEGTVAAASKWPKSQGAREDV
jgi:hypothetical protein